jgi:hypothetical protein
LQLSSPTRHPPALPPSTQPPLPVPSLPLRQPSPSGQEAPAEDGGSGHHGQVLFGREVNRSILVHILLNKLPSSVAGQSQQLLAGTGILRNPPESGGFRVKYRNSCPKGIPAKNSCKNEKKQEFLQPPPKPRSCEKFLRKTQEKKEILRNPVRIGFLDPKNKFLKTGITNLGCWGNVCATKIDFFTKLNSSFLTSASRGYPFNQHCHSC